MDQISGRSISEVLLDHPLSYLFQLICLFRVQDLKRFVFAIPGLDFRSYLEVYLDLVPFAPH